MIFSLVHFDIHNVYISCKIYNIYIYIYIYGWCSRGWKICELVDEIS